MSTFQGVTRGIRSAGVRSGLGQRLFTIASARQSAQNNSTGDRRDVNPRRSENSESDDKTAELDTAFNPKETAPEHELRNADRETDKDENPLGVSPASKDLNQTKEGEGKTAQKSTLSWGDGTKAKKAKTAEKSGRN